MEDQETRMVETSDGKTYEVPAQASSKQISAYVKAIPAENASSAPNAPTWRYLDAPIVQPQEAGSDTGALLPAMAAKGLPMAARAAAELATNPKMPKTVATIGRVMGGMAPVAGAVYSGNPIAMAASPAAVPGAAWAGGRTGWFGGKMIQSAAGPVASALEKAGPATQQILGKASIVQGGLDLAQMAEPNRQDIGFLGVGMPAPRSETEKAEHPALINLLVQKLSDAVASLMAKGMSQGDAVRTIMNLKVKGQ